MYIFLVMILAYFGYIAYKELEKIKSKYYIINTYKRKLADEKYMEELEKDFNKKDKISSQSEKVSDMTNDKIKEKINDISLDKNLKNDKNFNEKPKEDIKPENNNIGKIVEIKNKDNTSVDEGGSWII